MLFISDWTILPAAFLLDFLLGDPLWLPHPVRWMGTGIEKLEPRFRQKIRNTKIAGLLFAAALIVSTWVLAAFVLIIARSVHPFAGKIIEIIMIYYAISAFSLKKAAMDVYHALQGPGLAAAREKLSHIVGRDVAHLDEESVLRAAVETVGENLVDGVISPLFWAGIGGAPLAMAFKMVNTLDSMVGYKNDEYVDFGMVSAKVDDAANFIPARISVLIIAFSAAVLKYKGREAMETGFKEGKNHASPNAGFPEAAFAGALGVCLGGGSVYEGIMVDKPRLGKGGGPVKRADLLKACRLMLVSSAAAVFMAMTLAHMMSFM